MQYLKLKMSSDVLLLVFNVSFSQIHSYSFLYSCYRSPMTEEITQTALFSL